jgi:hypothetical protein
LAWVHACSHDEASVMLLDTLLSVPAQQAEAQVESLRSAAAEHDLREVKLTAELRLLKEQVAAADIAAERVSTATRQFKPSLCSAHGAYSDGIALHSHLAPVSLL